MIRTNLWKQQLLEKLGKVEVTGDSPQIINQAKLLTDMKAGVKDSTVKLRTYVKAHEATAKEGKSLADSFATFDQRTKEHTELSVLGGVLKTCCEFQTTIQDLEGRLNGTLSKDVAEPLNAVLAEFKNGKMAKKRFEEKRVAYDAAVQKLQGLKKQKNAKADKLKQSEDEVTTARSTLESTGREALATMIDTNNFAEGETIAKLCLYLDAYKDYFDRCSKALLRLQSDIQNYREYSSQRKDDLEHSKAKVRASLAIGASPITQPEYFGTALDALLAQEGTEVPKLLIKAFTYLEKNDKFMKEEGLFRVAAAKSRVNKYIEDINAGKDVDFFESKPDPEVVTDLVKHFLRELPEPLLTYPLYDAFIQLNIISDPDAKIKRLKEIFQQLPTHNYRTTAFLFAFLNKVAANSAINKMGHVNLATIFGPCILYPQQGNPITMAEDMAAANVALTTCMQNYEKVFGNSVSFNAVAVSGGPGSERKEVRGATSPQSLTRTGGMAVQSKKPAAPPSTNRPQLQKVFSDPSLPSFEGEGLTSASEKKSNRSATQMPVMDLSPRGEDPDGRDRKRSVTGGPETLYSPRGGPPKPDMPPRRAPPAPPANYTHNTQYHINNLTTLGLPPPKRAPPRPPIA